MQYQVPQFIETEDTIIGSFSIRQFLYIGAAVLVSVMFYFFVQTWLFIIIAILLIGCSLLASFLKIEGRSIVDVAMSALGFYWKPQVYVWKADHIAAHERSETESEAPGSQLLKKILTESPLHKSWEGLQSGNPESATMSDRQFLEKKTNERYEIFHKISGDRGAARRIDYR